MTASRGWLAVPAVLLILVVALLLWWRPLDLLSAGAPPVEEAKVESVRLAPGVIILDLRTDGSEPVVIAQIQVDGAYRTFTATPERPTAWLGLTRFDIPYPWIAGEALRISLITQTGVVIEHSIGVAQLTPLLTGVSLGLLATVGLLLGAVPVGLGLLAWPAMGSISRSALRFILALTIGLLAFLFIDTVGEGLEAAG